MKRGAARNHILPVNLVEREAGQASLFEFAAEQQGRPNDFIRIRLPDVPPWSPRETLQHEKEQVGFYISGHPLEEFEIDYRSFATSSIRRFRERGDEAGEVRLLGYTLRPSQSDLALTLYWQAVVPPTEDYTLFVHLLGEDGRLLAQWDGQPVAGLYPTSAWPVGEIFTQQVRLPLPAAAPPGRYDLLAGMYTYPDLQRLSVESSRPYAQDGLVWLQSIALGEGP